MKLAFLIAAHAYPELLARLVRRIQSPAASIYIHIDKRADILPFTTHFAQEKISGVHWVPRVASGWATFGQVQASLSLLQAALANDKEASRFILLSGQDYPLMPTERMGAFFEQHPGVEFIECAPLPWSRWGNNGGLDRLQHYYFTCAGYRMEYPCANPPPTGRPRLAYEACRLLLPRKRRLPEGIAFHGGANWWNLTRPAAEAVLDYVRRHPAFEKSFRFTLSSDEIFFQTVLMNTGHSWNLKDDPLRSVFWDGRRNEHPAIVRLEDFEEIARSGNLFTRKIHPQKSAPLLDKIDGELLR